MKVTKCGSICKPSFHTLSALIQTPWGSPSCAVFLSLLCSWQQEEQPEAMMPMRSLHFRTWWRPLHCPFATTPAMWLWTRPMGAISSIGLLRAKEHPQMTHLCCGLTGLSFAPLANIDFFFLGRDFFSWTFLINIMQRSWMFFSGWHVVWAWAFPLWQAWCTSLRQSVSQWWLLMIIFILFRHRSFHPRAVFIWTPTGNCFPPNLDVLSVLNALVTLAGTR